MGIIGRKREQDDFLEWITSPDSELICVYGRRRIGKTYFVNNLLGEYYAFEASGVDKGGYGSQLNAFHTALMDYGDTNEEAPKNWWEAFRRLKALLDRDTCPRTPEGMRIVFLDELPWFETPRSDFLNAFSDFWNRWAQRRPDVKVIICGSATSWILKKVLRSEGSLNRRVTHSLYLAPFSLAETEQYLRREKNLDWDHAQIIECYMVFGGTPFYLRGLQPRLSLAQNITSLCLRPQAPFRDEARILLDSTLSDRPVYTRVLQELGQKKKGLTRQELLKAVGVSDGQGFTGVLMGLEECGFIRRYDNPYRKGRKTLYQLIDPFLLFSMRFIGEKKHLTDWNLYLGTPSYNAWRGIAFETVCLNNIESLRRALSLTTMATTEFCWESEGDGPQAQIDLVIERPDKVTHLCEMKYTNEPYDLNSDALRELRHKREVFRSATGTRNSLQIVLVCAAGVNNSNHGGLDTVSWIVTGDDLFT